MHHLRLHRKSDDLNALDLTPESAHRVGDSAFCCAAGSPTWVLSSCHLRIMCVVSMPPVALVRRA